MVTANNQHRTKYLRTSGFKMLRVVPGRLDSQALGSKVRLGGHRRAPLIPIKSNNVVCVCAIASLVLLFVLLELHIRALTNHSLSRRQPLGELKSQIEGMDPRTALGLDTCCLF
jgi:hypothetical protein